MVNVELKYTGKLAKVNSETHRLNGTLVRILYPSVWPGMWICLHGENKVVRAVNQYGFYLNELEVQDGE